MDENEKKETDETLKADANEAHKTDEANETSKTDANEQSKKETTVTTAKDKFAMYSVIAFLIVIPFCIIVTIAVNKDNDTDTSTSSSYSSDYDTSSYSSDYDTDKDYDTSSDDDASTSSFSDDYSALDYESQNCYDTAMSYLDFMAFSRNDLIQQLQHDGYTDTAISNALDLLEKDYVSWDIEAVKKAQEYMETFSFSQQRLYEQLIHDGFTEEQANYGASYVYNNNKINRNYGDVTYHEDGYVILYVIRKNVMIVM